MLYCLLLPAVNGFLLDTPQGNGGSSTTNQYLTLSKFYEEMKFQQEKVHRDTTELRHDTDNSLALLTTQMQQKFDLLDKKLAEIEGLNQTIPDFHNLEQKYIQLEQKYLKVEQNYNTLKLENNLLQNKKNQMENELFLLRNETNHQGQELAMLKNKSFSVDQNIEDLKTLRSIKPLQELKTLQQEVRSISAQTSSLNIKEQARNQVFLALYSKVQELTANSTRSTTNLSTQIMQMKTLQMNSNTTIMDLSTQMKMLQTNHNTSITDLVTQLKIVQKNQSTALANFELKIHEATITGNQTFTHLQQQIDKSMDLVAMTTQLGSTAVKSGIIKFDNVQFSIGIKNLSGYRSTGKFICESGGLYLISASIMSNTNGADYQIYLNGYARSYTRIGYNDQGTSMQYTGTVVLALLLHPNDSVWVNNGGDYHIYGRDWSTFTIVKIK